MLQAIFRDGKDAMVTCCCREEARAENERRRARGGLVTNDEKTVDTYVRTLLRAANGHGTSAAAGP